MFDFIFTFNGWINDVTLSVITSPWVPLFLVLFCFLDGVFPAVPSEALVIGLAAVGVSGEAESLLWVIPLAAIGAFMGDLLAYWLGGKFNIRAWSFMRHYRVQRAFGLAETAFARRAASFLLTARFIPVGRVAVSITAGTLRFSVRRFIPIALLAAFIWSTYSVLLGAFAGRWLSGNPFLAIVVGVVLGIGLGFFIDYLVSKFSRTARLDSRMKKEPKISAT